ncbi:LOW QUALITY PROTEIN: hypothetical protein BC936DRAFT_147297 [Jimgerdemannia flammicorona]|uniref:Uncharacterized protein n=1 Tax=Jimgerdemannia flammicorona TaxID=994334 RepID=A0A433DL96_9FUNG|nr:LOW QUALITY PROTEIN: hypothetical protein BC936DRAFT_147297 [Jimgerdemannia flammicorona]
MALGYDLTIKIPSQPIPSLCVHSLGLPLFEFLPPTESDVFLHQLEKQEDKWRARDDGDEAVLEIPGGGTVRAPFAPTSTCHRRTCVRVDCASCLFSDWSFAENAPDSIQLTQLRQRAVAGSVAVERRRDRQMETVKELGRAVWDTIPGRVVLHYPAI